MHEITYTLLIAMVMLRQVNKIGRVYRTPQIVKLQLINASEQYMVLVAIQMRMNANMKYSEFEVVLIFALLFPNWQIAIINVVKRKKLAIMINSAIQTLFVATERQQSPQKSPFVQSVLSPQNFTCKQYVLLPIPYFVESK